MRMHNVTLKSAVIDIGNDLLPLLLQLTFCNCSNLSYYYAGMKKRLFVFLSVILSLSVLAQSQWHQGALQVTDDGHYLQYKDGTPFFWLGDTGWELFHRLKLNEIEKYLQNRSDKGFTVIQAVLLPEFNGLRKPNQYGEVPLHHLDPTQPNENYFELVDTVVKLAQQKGLFMGLLPTWGDKVTKLWGEGPVVFDSVNAYQYGLFLGNRYAASPNIIWILGGDRPPYTDSVDYRPIWRQMAKGLQQGAGKDILITYHPAGGHSTSEYIHNEPWLDMNMMQSGHGSGHDVPVWNWITKDRNLSPAKPTLDAEPNYEDHPVNPWPEWNPANGYFRAYDVRKQTYRSVFAGACGVTYGHHAVWQFYNPREEKINHADRYWTEAIDRPGAFQVGYLRQLILSRPSLTRVPDGSLIADGQGEKGSYITAFRDVANTYAMIYLPVGKPISVNMSFLKSNKITIWWFNPKSGTAIKVGKKNKQPMMSFTPPTLGMENDWVLILDDPAYSYRIPGKTKN